MAFYDPKSQGLASVGTLLEIKEHARLEDGRLLVQNIGTPGSQVLQRARNLP